jgi:hypothetical protein
MKKYIVLVEHGEYYHYDEKTGEECVMDKTYTTYTLCKEPKFYACMNVYVWKISDNSGE